MDISEFEDRILDELQGEHPADMPEEKQRELIDLTQEQIEQKQIEYQLTEDVVGATGLITDEDATPIAAKVTQVIHGGLGQEVNLPSSSSMDAYPEAAMNHVKMSQEKLLKNLANEKAYLEHKLAYLKSYALEDEEAQTPVPEEGQDPETSSEEDKSEQSDEQIQETEKELQETREDSEEALKKVSEETEQDDEESTESGEDTSEDQENQEDLQDTQELDEVEDPEGDQEEIKITLENAYLKALHQAAHGALDRSSQEIVRFCVERMAKRKGIKLRHVQSALSVESILKGKDSEVVGLVEQLLNQR